MTLLLGFFSATEGVQTATVTPMTGAADFAGATAIAGAGQAQGSAAEAGQTALTAAGQLRGAGAVAGQTGLAGAGQERGSGAVAGATAVSGAGQLLGAADVAGQTALTAQSGAAPVTGAADFAGQTALTASGVLVPLVPTGPIYAPGSGGGSLMPSASRRRQLTRWIDAALTESPTKRPARPKPATTAALLRAERRRLSPATAAEEPRAPTLVPPNPVWQPAPFIPSPVLSYQVDTDTTVEGATALTGAGVLVGQAWLHGSSAYTAAGVNDYDAADDEALMSTFALL